MNNAELVALTPSDLDTVSGGSLLTPDALLTRRAERRVLKAVGLTYKKVEAAARDHDLSPGSLVANGLAKGADSAGKVIRALFH